MSLKQWAANGWVKEHVASRAEIAGLVAIVARDFGDAAKRDLSADWRFGIAYNAVLKLCTILLHASGYRVERALHHYPTLQALPLILGAGRQADADYLDACRVKRNAVEYDRTGAATHADADELLAFAIDLRVEVLAWFKAHHSRLA